jgi:hypothetical protein
MGIFAEIAEGRLLAVSRESIRGFLKGLGVRYGPNRKIGTFCNQHEGCLPAQKSTAPKNGSRDIGLS